MGQLTRKLVEIEGGQVEVRRLSILDLMAVWHSKSQESAIYTAALPAGFDLAALSMKDQLAVLNAIVELNGDIAKQLEEVAEDGMSGFRGRLEAGGGTRGPGGGPGGDLEDASGESAASPADGGSQGAPA